MAIIHMVEVKKMRSFIGYKYALLILGAIFLSLPFSFVSAVTYNSGLYNAGYYSSTAPSALTATPIAGAYNSTQSVELTATGSTSIRYSTTSTPADCSSGTLYTTPISVSSSATIYVRACNAYGNSSTDSFVYIIDADAPSTPIATPSAGNYHSNQSVVLTSTGSDYIKYSTTSIPASCSSGTLYSSPIQILSSTTLYVKACDNQGNYSQSEFEYIISKKTVTGTTALFRNNFLEQQKALSNPNLDTSLGLKKFNRSLSLKMTGEDVRALQVYLNAHGYIVATSGPGSPGKETNYFGIKTKKALMLFQKANKISPVGIAGPITRAVLNK